MPSALLSLVGPAHQLLLLLAAFKCDVFWANNIKFDLIGNVSSRQATCVALYTGIQADDTTRSLYSRRLYLGERGKKEPPPKKKVTVPPNGCQIGCSNFFSAGTMNKPTSISRKLSFNAQ